MNTTNRLFALFFIISGIIYSAASYSREKQNNTKEQLPSKNYLYKDALTFAQTNEDDRRSTILVLDIFENRISGVNLSHLNNNYSENIFDVVAGVGWEEVKEIAKKAKNTKTTFKEEVISIAQLIGVGPSGLSHIAAGTNYPEHGKETGMNNGAFLFPKFSAASGPMGSVSADSGILLDYEAEVCARFDREIRSTDDFESARKGFFLCGDFSDRATLMRNINLKNPYSGDGFPDAKSGIGRFPTGPFLVVPKDWKKFLAHLKFNTLVNNEPRQKVNASDMIKDLKTIVLESLAEGSTRTWLFEQARVHMIQGQVIGTEMAILTGTGDGVVFQEPSQDLINQLVAAKNRSQELSIINAYIESEIKLDKYLQPDDTVIYTSNFLGKIETKVTSALKEKI
ncbi:hypothetical protein TDB9533_00738 [Thalassocella blandensis]|nr:hypothetical protein TDB9533_00738 [Thalassocella blandensis]